MREGINIEIEIIENKPVEYMEDEKTGEWKTIERVGYGYHLHIDKTVHISYDCRDKEIKPYLEYFMNSLAEGISKYGSNFKAEDGLKLLGQELEKYRRL